MLKRLESLVIQTNLDYLVDDQDNVRDYSDEETREENERKNEQDLINANSRKE